MKKTLLLLLSFMMTITLYGEEFAPKKIHEYQMGTASKGLYLRHYEEVAPQDDISKNYLMFTKDGNINIYQADTSRIIYLNNILEIENEEKLNLLIGPYDCMYTDNHFLMSDKSGRIYLFDMKLNRKAYFETFDVLNTNNTGIWLAETYYDEASDILFFRDSNEALHCIVHPGMNDEENQKNYKNPEQTLELFENEVTINGTSIRVTKRGSLFVNGNYTYWGQLPVGDYVYQINRDDVFCYDQETAENTFNVILSDDSEEIESIAIHPSGDIYVLRMNWQTNTHNLYYIENTWDPQWREQWYKEHSSENK